MNPNDEQKKKPRPAPLSQLAGADDAVDYHAMAQPDAATQTAAQDCEQIKSDTPPVEKTAAKPAVEKNAAEKTEAAPTLTAAQIKARSLLQSLQNNLASVVKTQPQTLELVLVNLLCQGHLLLEDAPGLGKTTLAQALSKSLALRMQRLQCTPDLMPSDITGISVYNSEQHEFHFVPGPVFTNILLADEINRATPRAQSALLEAMAEGTVSVDRKSYKLPQPFMVIATQNPQDYSGTYPLPEAQLDRFFMRLSLGYPDADAEVALMQQQLHSVSQGHPLAQLKAVLNEKMVTALQAQAEQVQISASMLGYISQLVRATREHDQIALGASPRGSLALMRAARALALLRGDARVTPALVQMLLEPVLAHRLLFSDNRLYQAQARAQLWQQIIASVAVPDYPAAAL